MNNYFKELIANIDRNLSKNADRPLVYEKLRQIGLTAFGEFMFSLPDENYPSLSKHLPSMAEKEVQINWTGNHSRELLRDSLDFVRLCSSSYSQISGFSLFNKKILDYGCGYGRLMRLFYYYTAEENLYAVDPWEKSIKICQKHNLNNFYKSEYVPEKLPIPDLKFDLIYAFSVFTHLDKQSATACLNMLSNYLSKNGVLIFTIRPPEFWDNRNTHVSKLLIQKKRKDLIKTHEKTGFAFFGSGGTDSPHYGDASISIDWLKKNLNLNLVNVDYSLLDEFQICVSATKK